MKNSISLLIYGTVFLFAVSAMAQTPKVVVIPLNSGVARSQSCPAGEAVTGIDSDGTIICEAFQTCSPGKCWRVSSFTIAGSNISNSCVGGSKYVKQSDFDPTLYVGAMLCNANRYKLFLATTSEGIYYEISDTAGVGQDHCELIGGTNTTDIGAFIVTSGESGFWRNSLGEAFTFSTPVPINAFRAEWYECGMTIP